mmetsp:Transcript_45237/g.115762  ORF Transcript_45237/g.115762 Transcript_45237/m.115762 type:complete len:310 (-) Transcript_45237:202-1131(-)
MGWGREGVHGAGPPVHGPARCLHLPVDGRQPLLFQQRVSLGKVLAAEEAAAGRQSGGVRAFENVVAAGVDEALLVLRLLAPQQEDHAAPQARDGPDRLVREGLPALSGVRVGLVRAHCQHRVEHEYSLRCPLLQVAVRHDAAPAVRGQLLIDVQQARGALSVGRHAEAEAHGLAGPVVGVLPQDHHLDFVQRDGVVCTKDERLRREDRLPPGPLLLEELLQLRHVWLGKIRAHGLPPARLHQQAAQLEGLVLCSRLLHGAPHQGHVLVCGAAHLLRRRQRALRLPLALGGGLAIGLIAHLGLLHQGGEK